MSHKEVLYGWFILITLAFVAILLLLEPSPSLTGYAVSLLANPEVNAEKIWDFSTSTDYTYNSSAISVNGTAQLLLITTTASTSINEINESSLLFATEYKDAGDDDDDDDNVEGTKNRTNKVNAIGNGHVQLKDNKSVLEVILNQQLQNNDALSLYLLSGTDASGRIYLCKNSSGCSTGDYGNRTLPGIITENWHNITLSGILGSIDLFFIDSPEKIKIDMVKGYQKSSRIETTTSTSYLSSSSIETADLQPANWKRWGAFSKTEQGNGQTVNYYYSTNSGSTWTVVPANLNLSTVTGNIIRFKVELNSNTTATPTIDTVTLAYTTQQPCTESWGAQYGSCLKNDSKLKYYSDGNECGTVNSLPSDNSTYVSCDYCALFNCSASVIQKPVAEIRENKTVYVIDAHNDANTKLEIEAGHAPANVEIIAYSHNIKNETPSSIAVNRYVDLQSNETTISFLKIMLYYNDSEIAALDENTLKIYYYNETSKAWDALPSTVNTSGNYVSATVPHLSLYGLFGEPPSSDSGSSSSTSEGSGGGGGGRSKKIDKVIVAPGDAAIETAETLLPTRSEAESAAERTAPAAETVCEYVVEMSLPDELVLGEGDSYEGEITNKGNCVIPELKLGLSPELEPRVSLSILQFGDIQPGDKERFILIRKKGENNDLFSATSYVIGSLKMEKKVLGQVILRGYDGSGEIFGRELPVSIVLKNSFPVKELITLGSIALLLLIFGVRMWYGKEIKKRKKK